MKILKSLLFFFTFILVKNYCNAQLQSGIIRYTCTRNMNEFTMSFNKDNVLADTTIQTRYGAQIFETENLLIFKNNEVSFFYMPNKQQLIKEINKKVQSYQNFNTRLLINSERTKGKSYITFDTMTPIAWKLSKNTKKIQNIECFSAQAEYRGRVWTAWYAPSIPISSGPWKLYGLPGMILEAEDKGNFAHFECTYISVPPIIDFAIEIPKALDAKDKSISMKQYAIFAEKDIINFEKMSTDKEGSASVGVQNIEIFDFEKNLTMKRFQQKLSDIPKK